MANAGAKLSSFPEVNDIQTGDMFPLLSGGDTNAKIDYATLARAIIAKLKSEDVVQTQTNNANKLISAALAYSMNQSILQLEEDTSTEQEEKSVTAGIVTVEDADGGDAGLTLNLEPHQSGSGDPSPENIRLITGWTAAKVTRCGKNLYSRENGEYNVPVYANDGSTASYVDVNVVWLKVKPNVTYHVSFVESTQAFYFRWINCDKNKGFISRFGIYNSYKTIPDFTTTAETEWVEIAVNQYDAGNTSKNDWLICISETATDYEPYSGQTYDITFPSEVGTVYGGTLDVTSGVLTVTDAQIASYAGETLPGEWISDRDVYAAGASPTTGAQVVYELATPVTYRLTPIEVTTLLGDNTIWMDAEGIIKLDYKTNAIATKGDVNNALARIKALAKITEAIAPVESSYTATQNYAIGDYLIVDYKLYKVTAAITSGATITEGTNVTATTIMAEIQALA